MAYVGKTAQEYQNEERSHNCIHLHRMGHWQTVKHKVWTIFLFASVLVVCSCGRDDRFRVDVSDIEVSYNLTRFENDFYSSKADSNSLELLRQKYEFFITPQMTDSIILAKKTDTLEVHLFEEAQKQFENFSTYRDRITEMFRHVRYYYPDFAPPDVYTYISDLDYPNDVFYAHQDTLLFIALDFFLGKERSFYHQYPLYIAAGFDQQYLLRQVAYKIADVVVNQGRMSTLLDGMMYEAKKALLVEAFSPTIEPHIQMKYTQSQWEWCAKNEYQIWKYFVEKKMFYKSYEREKHRFVSEAPYSKFYLTLDNTSPGRVGVWLGLQILHSYLKNHPNVSLNQLIENTNYQQIFTQSGYSPAKKK